MPEILYHLTLKEAWEESKKSEQPYYPPTYKADGFIHLSGDRGVLLEVANHFYKSEPGEWVVLCINASKLSSEVKWEPAAPVGPTPATGLPSAADGELLFPHLYGTIDRDAVKQVVPVKRDASGTFLSIDWAWQEVESHEVHAE